MNKINNADEMFSDLVLNDKYYFDKTLFIKDILDNHPSKVLLLMRPPKFGKTVTMSTFYEFLRMYKVLNPVF